MKSSYLFLFLEGRGRGGRKVEAGVNCTKSSPNLIVNSAMRTDSVGPHIEGLPLHLADIGVMDAFLGETVELDGGGRNE